MYKNLGYGNNTVFTLTAPSLSSLHLLSILYHANILVKAGISRIELETTFVGGIIEMSYLLCNERQITSNLLSCLRCMKDT